MRFSIVVCTYGRARSLEHLLDSLAVQTYRDFEVLVVDGNQDSAPVGAIVASSDGALDVRHIPSPKGLYPAKERRHRAISRRRAVFSGRRRNHGAGLSQPSERDARSFRHARRRRVDRLRRAELSEPGDAALETALAIRSDSELAAGRRRPSRQSRSCEFHDSLQRMPLGEVAVGVLHDLSSNGDRRPEV